MAKFWLIVFVVFITLGVITGILIISKEPTTGVHYTNTYTNITTPEAKQLIKSTSNLSIVDVRGLEGCSSCQFKRGHLPGAVMYENPEEFYNTTNDILVYSVDGTKGCWFCGQLMGQVFGNVYNLEGGWNDWKS